MISPRTPQQLHPEDELNSQRKTKIFNHIIYLISCFTLDQLKHNTPFYLLLSFTPLSRFPPKNKKTYSRLLLLLEGMGGSSSSNCSLLKGLLCNFSFSNSLESRLLLLRSEWRSFLPSFRDIRCSPDRSQDFSRLLDRR